MSYANGEWRYETPEHAPLDAHWSLFEATFGPREW